MLSNLFVPKSSKQFRLKSSEGLDFEDTSNQRIKTSFTILSKLPVAIWDGWKINCEFKKVLGVLETNTVSNDHALWLIEKLTKQKHKQYL